MLQQHFSFLTLFLLILYLFLFNTDSSIIQWKGLKSAQNCSLLLKPTLNVKLLVNQFNNATPENNN